MRRRAAALVVLVAAVIAAAAVVVVCGRSSGELGRLEKQRRSYLTAVAARMPGEGLAGDDESEGE